MAQARPAVVKQSYSPKAKIDKFTPHPDNPKKNDPDIIKESVEANGFYGAIIVQKSTSYILIGEHRWKAAKAAGAKTIPALIVDVDDAQARRLMVVDNRTRDLASTDYKTLAKVLADVQDEGGFQGTGFIEDDYRMVLKHVAEDPSEELLPEAPGAPGGGEGESEAEREQPRTCRVTCGEYVYVVPSPAYTKWLGDVTAGAGGDEDAVIAHLKSLLGVDRHEDRQ